MAEKIKKKSVVKNEYSEELIKMIKIIIIVGLIIFIVYILTSYLSKNGKFSDKYKPNDVPQAVLTYEDATIGTVFNRTDKEYYVIFEEFGDKNKVYINTLLLNYSNKEKKVPLYKVNMSLKTNKEFASESSNKNAKTASSLKIKAPSLLKIKNHSIIKYVEGYENIKSELE